MISIETLHALPGHRSQVGAWLAAQWPAWYGAGGPGDLAGDLDAYAASADALPLGLLLLEDGQPLGFAALKTDTVPGLVQAGPWAGAGYICPERRGRGLGALLLAGLVEHALRLGHPRVYCATATARSLLERAGWVELQCLEHQGGPLTVFGSPAPAQLPGKS